MTIAGAGGCGKTRLALEALAGTAGSWTGGSCWVDLGPVTDPDRVAEVTAAAAGVLVDQAVGPVRALVLRFRDRHMVVCLDNCEHLLDACGELVEVLLANCPDVTVLATSREPLGVVGVWRVSSMAEGDAMDLFADRARWVRPEYLTNQSNQEPVRTICRRLDGIPLALELAAARVGLLTPSQIATALDDRFRLLVGAWRGIVPRQQTLAASVDWSHGLLRDDARTLLRRLSVFSGGFTLESAQAVCPGERLARDQVLAALARLVNASIVVVGERDGISRYRLPETIRAYTGSRLDEAGETTVVRDRHLDHFLEVAELAAAALNHEDQDEVLAGLEAEHDNLRAALEWGLSSPEPGRARRLAVALLRLWFLHGHAHECIQYLQRAVALAPRSGPISSPSC